MLDRLAQLEKHFNDIETEMANPDVVSNVKRLQELAQERSNIQDVVTLYRQYKSTERQMEEARSMLETETDEEMRGMAKQELMALQSTLESLLASLKTALLPRDPNDDRDVIVEIRAGAGGDEAGLFAGELFRMYSRYAERRGWRSEILDLGEGGAG